MGGVGGDTRRAKVENRRDKNKCRENEEEVKYKWEIDVKTKKGIEKEIPMLFKVQTGRYRVVFSKSVYLTF
jgi:hypothetical protein